VLAEDLELQDTLRRNRDRIPNFVEEMLRLEPDQE
jgi:cytochrome P450